MKVNFTFSFKQKSESHSFISLNWFIEGKNKTFIALPKKYNDIVWKIA